MAARARLDAAVVLVGNAADNGHHAVVAQLLEARANVNRANNSGATPLFHAARRGYDAVVAQLVRAGADVNRANEGGETPLFGAAHYDPNNDHGAVVAQLLAAGANVNQARNDGVTPLHKAAQQGRAAIVAQLVAAGADVDRANQSGDTPLNIAARNDHINVVEMLCQYMQRKKQIHNEQQLAINRLMRRHNAPHGTDTRHIIAQYVDDYVDSINVPDHTGKSPLWIAAQRFHVNVVRCLLHYGANRNKTDNNNITPLQAARANDPGGDLRKAQARAAVIELLSEQPPSHSNKRPKLQNVALSLVHLKL